MAAFLCSPHSALRNDAECCIPQDAPRSVDTSQVPPEYYGGNLRRGKIGTQTGAIQVSSPLFPRLKLGSLERQAAACPELPLAAGHWWPAGGRVAADTGPCGDSDRRLGADRASGSLAVRPRIQVQLARGQCRNSGLN